MNKILKSSLPNNVLENTHNFVPHITIFKINDYSSFEKHKENLEKILSNFIKKISAKDTSKSLNIFQVDSTKEPELQILLND